MMTATPLASAGTPLLLAPPTTPAPDHELPLLMREYCAGRVDAFLRLYAVCAPAVCTHLRQRLRGGVPAAGGSAEAERHLAQADERVAGLLDETFLALHERRSMYVLGADPRRWLLEIADVMVARERRRHEPGWLRRGLNRLGWGNVPALRGAS